MNKDLENKIEDVLSRGVADFIDPDGTFKKKLVAKAKGEYKKDIIIKYGVDPTRPDIHLGHAACFCKLRQLQELECKIVFLVGDFTARIGDPSGKSKIRPEIEQEEIDENMKTYLNQIEKILEVKKDDKGGIVMNSEKFSWIRNFDWYMDITDISVPKLVENAPNTSENKAKIWENTRMQKIIRKDKTIENLTLTTFLAILKKITHARLIERDMFKKRISNDRELYMHEMIYPVLQGTDSFMLYKIYGSCDLELGGTDQKFNMLIGRDIMKAGKQDSQSVMTIKILEGTDGKEKMSQSLGNYIGIMEESNSMFGKIMSIPDNLIINYFELCTDIPMGEIKEMEEGMKDEKINPRDAKIKLAEEIVKIYHGGEEARKAKEYFINTFSEKKIPDDIPEIKVADDEIKLTEFLVLSKTADSLSGARRKIEQGGVEINGKKETNWRAVLKKSDDGAIIKVGKKDFVKCSFRK